MQLSKGDRRPKILYLAAAIILALFALKNALVSGLAERAPGLALDLSPHNATALVSQFDRSLAEGGDRSRQLLESTELPKSALRDAPLSPGAIRMLALAMELRSKGASAGTGSNSAGALMNLSERLSRRDLAVQLWLIEEAVLHDDLSGALLHYDRALSVHPDVSVQLFPVMTGALDTVQVASALAPYVRTWRPWVPGFLEYAVNQSADPVNILRLLRLSNTQAVAAKLRPYETLLLAQLVVKGQYEEANKLAIAMAGRKGKYLSAFGFSGESTDPELRPFSWTLGDEGGIGVRLTEKSALEVSVSPSTRGIAASRVLVAQPGRYLFSQALEFPESGDGVGANWVASCLSPKGNMRIWLQDIPNTPGVSTYRSQFDVPNDCSALIVELSLNGVDSQFGTTFKILSVDLRRVQQTGR